MTRLAIFASLACLLASNAFGDEALTAIARIRSAASYKAHVKHEWREREGIWPFRHDAIRFRIEAKTIDLQGSGSGWVLSGSSGDVMVTAAHVIQLNTSPASVDGRNVDGKYAWISERKITCLVGGLAFQPTEFAPLELKPSHAPAQPLDLVLLRFAKREALKGLKEYRMADRLPKLGEKVTAIGLPSTDFPQPAEISVVHVEIGAGFFVLNESLPPGYSGGVVIDEKGRALGVVTGQTNKQTTVLMINNALVRTANYRRFNELVEWHSFALPKR